MLRCDPKCPRWSLGYKYDSQRRLTQITSPAGAFNYGYQFQPASTLVTGIGLPNGASIANSYDSLARLTETDLNGMLGRTLDGCAYQYDLSNKRTNIVRNLGLTASTIAAGYDTVGELTSWNASETNGTPRLNEQLAWAYDPAGNLRLRSNGALAQTFTVDALNELTNVSRAGTLTLSGCTPAPAATVTVNGLAAETYGDFTFARTNLTPLNGNNTFTNIAQDVHGSRVTNISTANLPASATLAYDLNGNLTNDGLRSFAWNAENELTNVTATGAYMLGFVYDGMGRRRIERDYSWNGSAWVKTNETRIIYDGYLPVQERDANNNALVTYTRGLDLSGSLDGAGLPRQSLATAGGIGGLLARTDTSGPAFYHADGNGNITALMDARGNIAARYEYNPYGSLIGQWGALAVANEMRFSSKPYNPLANDYDYGFRRYRPDLQRWLNRDPIGEMGFSIESSTLLNGVEKTLQHIQASGFLRNSRLTMKVANAIVMEKQKDAGNPYWFVKNDSIDYNDPLGLNIGCGAGYGCIPTPYPDPNCPVSTWGCKAACRGFGVACGALCTAATEGWGLFWCLSACAVAEQFCEDLCK